MYVYAHLVECICAWTQGHVHVRMICHLREDELRTYDLSWGKKTADTPAPYKPTGGSTHECSLSSRAHGELHEPPSIFSDGHWLARLPAAQIEVVLRGAAASNAPEDRHVRRARTVICRDRLRLVARTCRWQPRRLAVKGSLEALEALGALST